MKTKIGFFTAFLFFLFLAINLKAQQPTFTKVYFDPAGSAQGYAIIKTFDQNYLIAGEKDLKGLVMKLDQSGSILWSKKIGEFNNTRFNCVTATHDSCFVLAGISPDAITGNHQILCVKVNATGDTIWNREINMGLSSVALSIELTNDHGFILCGCSSQDITPLSEIIAVKLDSSGNISWSSILSAGNYTNYAYSIKQTSDGGYIMIGDLDNSPPYSASACLIRLTANGTISWAKKVYGSDADYYSGFDVVITPTGYLCYLNNEINGYVLLKTDFYGNFLWSRKFDAYTPGPDPALPRPKLRPTSDGGFVFLTTGWGGEPLIKIDSLGNFLWVKIMMAISSDVIESDDHGLLFLGNGPIMGVKSNMIYRPQIGVIKTDSLGNSVGCVADMMFTTETMTLNIAPITCTVTTGGSSMTSSHPEDTNTTLSTFDGCVDITGGTTEKKSDEAGFSISPNPSDGHFQIMISKPDNLAIRTIEIYNVMGEMIYRTFTPVSDRLPIDLSSRPDGIYYVKALIHNKICSQKILISR
ncbi:MAG: T9SS type A sorting domain-containing protein [Bacteroidota bacterium]